MSYPRPPLEERFWARVSPEPNTGCWLWEGSGARGYGTIMLNYVAMKATHVSLMLHGRPRPSVAMHALHHCDVPQCVNPEHLYWGTDTSNTMDAYRRGRRATPAHIVAKADRQRAQTHCKHGHEYTSENTYWSKGGRSCRICNLLRSSARQKRLRPSIAGMEV